MSESLKVSGKKFALDSQGTGPWKFIRRPGGWLIAEGPDGQRHRFAAWEGKGKVGFAMDGSLFYGELVESRKHRGSGASAGDTDWVAQFPGKVRKILVADGARVEEGVPMILIEAMKMEFTVKAPFRGLVKKVLVTEGQQLSPGDRFFDLAAEAEANANENER